MPGIVGLITGQPRQDAEAKLARMIGAMIHEPSYTSGTWVDERLGIYVGWVARAGSFADNMPLENEKRDLVLIFSGEEYAESDTETRLKGRGHILSDKNCSYLVHVAEEDRSFPKGLNGRFHGLLINKARGDGKLFL